MANRMREQRGWWLVGAIVSAILVVALITMSVLPPAEGARAAIRFTARTSLVLFLLAFTASALHRFWLCGVTVWLRRNRRYLGLSFAGSHLVHAVAILAYLQADPAGSATPISWRWPRRPLIGQLLSSAPSPGAGST